MVPTLSLRLRSMGVGPYAAMAKPLLQKPLQAGKRLVNNSKVTDHHAIIPTEQTLNLAALDQEEKRLYDLIARRFLAVLSPPYRYHQTTIITVVNGENFYSRGKVEIDRGWRVVQGAITDTEETGEEQVPEQTLARHQKGTRVEVKSCKTRKHKTKPPAPPPQRPFTPPPWRIAAWGRGSGCGVILGSGHGLQPPGKKSLRRLLRTSYMNIRVRHCSSR